VIVSPSLHPFIYLSIYPSIQQYCKVEPSLPLPSHQRRPFIFKHIITPKNWSLSFCSRSEPKKRKITTQNYRLTGCKATTSFNQSTSFNLNVPPLLAASSSPSLPSHYQTPPSHPPPVSVIRYLTLASTSTNPTLKCKTNHPLP